ncbi:MAG: sensor histidine kinase [Candidatus Methanomarinus sp.]|jgi:signal transduction histidine kinase|uniref:Sensor histidine kinase n=1 Tax=Candidatus Methanomarinus sp. TaxID=3386244 RepID=A0AC61SBC4_9EURY|nr:Signal transduction histidine kinase [ANME-2 cluster archaeon]TKY91873.1 MAG: sensor histidine kinase [ANME-2 cluster archaeon]
MNRKKNTRFNKSEEKSKEYYKHLNLMNEILRHDILNDLTVISGAFRLYEINRKEKNLEMTLDRINKCIETINRMRDLELFYSSHTDLTIFSVTDVLEDVIKHYPSITFNIEGQSQILADECFTSIFENLISNAIIHGKTDAIDIKIKTDAKYCKVSIADEGIGIPDKIKKKIFDKNFAYGETGKTGLGLYVVREVMKYYGGYVCVEDNTPKGTVVTLVFRKVK